MKGWENLPDDDYYTNKHAFTFPDGSTFIVAYHRVLFGFRIVGYWKYQPSWIRLNWCCGNDPAWIARTHLLMMTIVQKIPLNEIPSMSVIKPWYKDDDFVKKVDDLWCRAMEIPVLNILRS